MEVGEKAEPVDPKKVKKDGSEGGSDTEDESESKKPETIPTGNNGMTTEAGVQVQGVDSLLESLMDQQQKPISTEYFSTDSILPKPMPSMAVVTEMVKTLKAYYMLLWSKHLMRELFGITDLKIQDYSPNENQKVWDKQIHRKSGMLHFLQSCCCHLADVFSDSNFIN